MEDSFKGVAGVFLGLIEFVPFQVLAQRYSDGSLSTVPAHIKFPLILYLKIMFSSPITFWWLKLIIERLGS